MCYDVFFCDSNYDNLCDLLYFFVIYGNCLVRLVVYGIFCMCLFNLFIIDIFLFVIEV